MQYSLSPTEILTASAQACWISRLMKNWLAHWKREYVNANELPACHLPRVIQSRKPTTKPESWYGQPELLQEILNLAIPVRGSIQLDVIA